MRTNIIPTLLVLWLVVAACTPQAAPELPTLIPMEEAPTATAEPVIQQTATPSQTPTITNTPIPLVRNTLPPTFTPSPTMTLPPTETPFIPTATPFIPPERFGQPPSCDGFEALFVESTVEFTIGEEPTVRWTSVPGAELYRINLIGLNGRIQLRQQTADTQYTFPGDQFREGQIFAWEVWPLDPAGFQMCAAVGQELIPRAAPAFQIPGQ